jgi:hypothetical protein
MTVETLEQTKSYDSPVFPLSMEEATIPLASVGQSRMGFLEDSMVHVKAFVRRVGSNAVL